jgi:hypothetical protein
MESREQTHGQPRRALGDGNLLIRIEAAGQASRWPSKSQAPIGTTARLSIAVKSVLTQFWCSVYGSLNFGSGSRRARSSSIPARPYICRFRILSRLMCPSTGPLLHVSNATLFANAGCFRKIKCKHGNAMCKWQRKLVRATSWRARAWGQHVSFQKHPLKTWIRLLSADGECRLCD